MLHIVVYAFTAGSIFLLFLTILVTPRKTNIRANRWLGLFLFSFACIILGRALLDTHVYLDYPIIEGLLEFPRFAMAPALYFSLLYFTLPDRKFKTIDFLHFIPFFLFALYILIVVFQLQDSAAFSWYHDLPKKIHRAVAFTVFISIKIQMIAYWILSYVQLVKHFRNIQKFASTIEPISLWWFRYFLIGLGAALFLSLNDTLMIIPELVKLTHFGYLFLTFYLGYFLLRQQEIYPYPPKDLAEIGAVIKDDIKTSRTQRFTPEELTVSKAKLMQMMESEKIYLDPDLGLPQLADKVQLSIHDLSFLINEGFHSNFFEFINRYRIEEAKILLKSPRHKHLTILGIAHESGFRSKSTFNAAFKKLTGLSPSQFVQSGAAANPA